MAAPAPEAPKAEPEPEPEPEPEGEGSMTPGDIMGIPLEPETPEEHAERLGEAAGTFVDAGHILGTLEPRLGWPGLIQAAPVVDPEPEPRDPLNRP